MWNRHVACGLCALLFALAGCAATRQTEISESARTTSGSGTSSALTVSVEGIDAREAPRQVYQLDIYRVAAPRGKISNNEAVWRTLDEEIIDPSTRDLLDKNGILVGTAPIEELKNLEEELANPELSRKSLVGQKAQRVELELQTNIRDQTLFWFDSNGELRGRTFDACSNYLAFSFRSTLRSPDKVTLDIAPLVRGQRTQISVIGNGPQREVEFVKPETIYDLGISVELPLDRFVIIAPSNQSRINTSIGHLFFTRDDPAQQMECAIVIVPQIVRMLEQKGD